MLSARKALSGLAQVHPCEDGCATCNNNGCITCDVAFWLEETSLGCLSCETLTHCAARTRLGCTRCDDWFFVSDEACEACQSFIVHCNTRWRGDG